VPETTIDKKAVGIYLGITYGVSWLLAIILAVSGGFSGEEHWLRQSALLVGLMMLPAAAALIASTLTGDKVHPRLRIWPIPPRPVIGFALLAPIAFIGIYGLSAATGYASFDWTVSGLQSQMPAPQDVGLQQQMPALFLLFGGFLLSIVLGPTLFALLSLGNEIGWRAYLAQKLTPLGRLRAAVFSGALWGLGWFPLLFFGAWAGDSTYLQALSFSIRAVIAATIFGVILAELFRRSRHVGLTAVFAGCFYAQELGIWPYLVPRHDSLVAGPLGVIGILLFVILALAMMLAPAWERLFGIERPAPEEQDPNAQDPA